MKTKEELLKGNKAGFLQSSHIVTTDKLGLIVELLVDIRELLNKRLKL